MKTTKDIRYCAAPYGFIATIPAGTTVVKAKNLPETTGYWAKGWRGMTATARNWKHNYGFMLTFAEIKGI